MRVVVVMTLHFDRQKMSKEVVLQNFELSVSALSRSLVQDTNASLASPGSHTSLYFLKRESNRLNYKLCKADNEENIKALSK